jgi:wyosine [tRNA(Phe)-imidazoG37] synthetase (radical SAM superfamily)
MAYKYLFGPVPSRRLGISLGIDMVPYKICNLNCIYCESGSTTIQTMTRTEYINYDELIDELTEILDKEPQLDYITFSGAGEPTLNINVSNVIAFLKKKYPQYKLALITNSILLTDPDVRGDISSVDVLLPSLDAVSDAVFHIINRPKPGLSSEDIVDALVQLRQIFKGQMWLEVFIVPGINDDAVELLLLKESILKIKPDKVHLNTLDRPGPEKWVLPQPHNRLVEIAEFLKPVPVEIIARESNFENHATQTEDKKEILYATLLRRPCSLKDLEKVLNMQTKELKVYLEIMAHRNSILAEDVNGTTFYKVNDNIGK